MDTELRARLAAVRQLIEAAEASAACESTDKAMAAVVESCNVLELLVGKEAEAASSKSKEVEKQWREMKDGAHRVQAQVMEFVANFWKNKAKENLREVEVLRSTDAGLEVRVLRL